MYEYRATVDRWVDGDTVDLVVDLGFTVHMRTRFRLLGVDTPETNRISSREAGLAATAFAESLAPEGSTVIVESKKTGKYGRWLGLIFPLDEEGNRGESVNASLLSAGHARPY